MDQASSELIYEKTDKDDRLQTEAKKKFAFTLGFQQINGFIASSDRISQLFANGLYRFKKTWSASASQTLNHRYFLNPGGHDKGLWIQDTALSLNKIFPNLPYNNTVSFSLSSTLPLSLSSRINDIITVSSAYMNWRIILDPFFNGKPHWIKNIALFIKPVGRYYVSRYTTSRTENQSFGGTPLPELLLGLQSAGFSLSITDYASLAGSYGRWIVFPYKTNYRRDGHSPYSDYYQRHYYLFSLRGNVKIEEWALSLSYSLVDRLDRQGRLETVVFDNRLSTWGFSLSYSFSFNSLFGNRSQKR